MRVDAGRGRCRAAAARRDRRLHVVFLSNMIPSRKATPVLAEAAYAAARGQGRRVPADVRRGVARRPADRRSAFEAHVARPGPDGRRRTVVAGHARPCRRSRDAARRNRRARRSRRATRPSRCGLVITEAMEAGCAVVGDRGTRRHGRDRPRRHRTAGSCPPWPTWARSQAALFADALAHHDRYGRAGRTRVASAFDRGPAAPPPPSVPRPCSAYLDALLARPSYAFHASPALPSEPELLGVEPPPCSAFLAEDRRRCYAVWFVRLRPLAAPRRPPRRVAVRRTVAGVDGAPCCGLFYSDRPPCATRRTVWAGDHGVGVIDRERLQRALGAEPLRRLRGRVSGDAGARRALVHPARARRDRG